MHESDLQQMIVNGLRTNPERIKKRGFPLRSDRVIDIFSELDIGAYGRADIVVSGIDTDVNRYVFSIYELKINTVSSKDIDQILRYYCGVAESVPDMQRDRTQIDMYLIGKEVEGFFYPISDIEFYRFQFDPFEGLTFRHCNYGSYGDVALGSAPDKISALFETPLKD